MVSVAPSSTMVPATDVLAFTDAVVEWSNADCFAPDAVSRVKLCLMVTPLAVAGGQTKLCDTAVYAHRPVPSASPTGIVVVTEPPAAASTGRVSSESACSSVACEVFWSPESFGATEESEPHAVAITTSSRPASCRRMSYLEELG